MSIAAQTLHQPADGRRHARILRLTLAAAIAAVAAPVALTAAQTATPPAGYQQAAARLDDLLKQAREDGFSDGDLAPVLTGLDRVAAESPPLVGDAAGFYRHRQAEIEALAQALPGVRATALKHHRDGAEAAVAALRDELQGATSDGTDSIDTDAVAGRLPGIETGLGGAATPRQVDGLAADLAQLRSQLDAAISAARAEIEQLHPAAAALAGQAQGNADQLRGLGQQALTAGRNDGTVASLLHLPGEPRATRRLEVYGRLLGAGGSVDQLALAAAGAREYQSRLHALLTGEMPHKVIAVSIAAQELWAYQDGKVVQDTLVTTGRPQLPTDIGAMHVISKDSPWKMHSPWPKGSPWWYPDATVQKVTWFTVTGEGMHDAYWESPSQYGPGSQNGPAASHGCIHLPNAANDFVFGWAEVGMPVIVFPGDGSPVASQLGQVTVDANGIPTTGPKGS